MALASGVQGMFQVGTGLLQAPQVPRSCDRVRFDDEMEKALYFSSGGSSNRREQNSRQMWSWSMIIITSPIGWLLPSLTDCIRLLLGVSIMRMRSRPAFVFTFSLWIIKTGVREIL